MPWLAWKTDVRDFERDALQLPLEVVRCEQCDGLSSKKHSPG